MQSIVFILGPEEEGFTNFNPHSNRKNFTISHRSKMLTFVMTVPMSTMYIQDFTHSWLPLLMTVLHNVNAGLLFFLIPPVLKN